MAIGLDANYFKYYIDSLIAQEESVFTRVMDYILSSDFIVCDTRDHIISEWRACTGSGVAEFVDYWIADKAASDQLRYIDTAGCPNCRRVVTRAGMPQRDAKTLSIFKIAVAQFVISHDIDFFEPGEKVTAGPARRRRLVSERRGSLCRLIEREFGIVVCDADHFYENVVA